MNKEINDNNSFEDPVQPRSPRWTKHYGEYSNEELRALKFESEEEINKATDMCWSDPDLIGLPRDYANGVTMFIPQEAVELFTAKGLKFTTSRLLSPADLTPDELARQRHRFGM